MTTNEDLMGKLLEFEQRMNAIEHKVDRMWAAVRPAVEKLLGE